MGKYDVCQSERRADCPYRLSTATRQPGAESICRCSSQRHFQIMDFNSPCLNCGFLKTSASAGVDDSALPRHLLTTNCPPSDVEAVHIREVIEGAQTRLSNLDTSIGVLEDLLTKLRGHRKRATEDIHHGRALLSIIRRLPVDILTEIFDWTLPDWHTPPRRPINWSPWLLGRVCSQWRTVSLSVSTLWSNIDSASPLPLIMAQIQRSNETGLNVRLSSSDTKALGPLVVCSRRWKSVDIQTGGNILPFLDRVHGNVPLLCQLKYRDSTGVGSGTAFEIAPQLTSVIVTGKPLTRLPWTQLTRLHQRIPRNEGLTRLGSAHSLVELSLKNSVSLELSLPHARGRPESILEFPRLHKLYIEDGRFLDFLLLPALEDLFIETSISPLISLIERSLCRIRKITTASSGLEFTPALLPVLTQIPTLLELRLSLSNADLETLLSHFTIPPPEDNDYRPPCPNLRVISLCGNPMDERQCSLLVAMVKSRCTHSDLSVLAVLDCSPGLYACATNTLETLRALGVDAEWLPEKGTRRKLTEWLQEYP
ncbi:hypothetical protein B0H16DRAFT_1584009, partial [Mycena metata]